MDKKRYFVREHGNSRYVMTWSAFQSFDISSVSCEDYYIIAAIVSNQALSLEELCDYLELENDEKIKKQLKDLKQRGILSTNPMRVRPLNATWPHNY